jgi:hypothetical protein
MASARIAARGSAGRVVAPQSPIVVSDENQTPSLRCKPVSRAACSCLSDATCSIPPLDGEGGALLQRAGWGESYPPPLRIVCLRTKTYAVIPAKAGIQSRWLSAGCPWIPAFAGMTNPGESFPKQSPPREVALHFIHLVLLRGALARRCDKRDEVRRLRALRNKALGRHRGSPRDH